MFDGKNKLAHEFSEIITSWAEYQAIQERIKNLPFESEELYESLCLKIDKIKCHIITLRSKTPEEAIIKTKLLLHIIESDHDITEIKPIIESIQTDFNNLSNI